MKLNPPATIIALIATAFGYMAWQHRNTRYVKVYYSTGYWVEPGWQCETGPTIIYYEGDKRKLMECPAKAAPEPERCAGWR